MKAILHHRYGPPEVLQWQDVEKPVVGDDGILVRVRACSVNPAEWFAMTGLALARPQLGLLRPRSPRFGVDYAGVVEAVGASVTDFRVGDAVFGGARGACAEYVVARKDFVAKPPNLTFEQAAAVPTAAITALQALRDHGKVRPGQHVLIHGASGGVGTFAVQLAKVFGAEVTAVCSSRNVELVRSLGADHVIDYTTQDFTRSDRRYDLLLDIAGTRTWADCRRILRPEATLVVVGGPKTNRWIGPLGHVLGMRFASLAARQKVVFFVANFNREDFTTLRDLLESGKVTPVIDRTYPMRETAEAMRYLGTGHASGKVVVTMEPADEA